MDHTLKNCVGKVTLGCRLKHWLGIGVGVNSPLAEQMARDLLTALYRENYSVDSAVGNKDFGALVLFTQEITANHLEPGSPENMAALDNFNRLADTLKLHVLPESLHHLVRQYVTAVVGRGKADAYTDQYFSFLINNNVMEGPQAEMGLLHLFANGKEPSKIDRALAKRLANQTDIRSASMYSLSISDSLKAKIGSGTAVFNQQHLEAVKAAIALLRDPNTSRNAIGRTFGNFTGLVDQHHRKTRVPEPA